MKQSSINAYNDLLATGQINRQHHIILTEMAMFQPRKFTRRQIEDYTELRANVVSGRVNELITLNKIKVVGDMECPISHRTVEALKLA